MRIFITYIAILGASLSYGQANLVPNGGFDDLEKKVKELGQISLATGWLEGVGDANADLFCSNAKSEACLTDDNAYGAEMPDYGECFAGIVAYSDKMVRPRTYLETRLLAPLDPGRSYCVKFLLSIGETSKFAVNHIGAYLSNEEVTDQHVKAMDIKPQIMHSKNRVFQENQIFESICQEYKAVGGETYITIGTFAPQSEITEIKIKRPKGFTKPQQPYAYYFIESVSVIPTDSISESQCSCEKVIAGMANMKVHYSSDESDVKGLADIEALHEMKVFFDSAASDANEFGNDALKKVAEILGRNPNYKLQIIGNTDKIEEAQNAELSLARANSVKAYLVASGHAEANLSVVGNGDTVPKSTAGTQTGNAKNRRVKFKVL